MAGAGTDHGGIDPLQQALWDGDRIEVPITSWPRVPERLIRVSAQAYTTRAQYEKLARVLPGLLDGRSETVRRPR